MAQEPRQPSRSDNRIVVQQNNVFAGGGRNPLIGRPGKAFIAAILNDSNIAVMARHKADVIRRSVRGVIIYYYDFIVRIFGVSYNAFNAQPGQSHIVIGNQYDRGPRALSRYNFVYLSITRFPGLAFRKRPPPDGQLRVAFPHRDIEALHKALGILGNVDDITALEQLGHRHRDYRLARAQILIEFHRIRSLGDRIDLERYYANVEVEQVFRHRTVFLMSQQPDVRQLFKRRHIYVEYSSEKNEGIFRPLSRRERDQLNIEPVGDSSKVTDYGMRYISQKRVRLAAFFVELIVHRIARQDDVGCVGAPLFMQAA